MAGAVVSLSLGRLTSAQRCRRFLGTILDPETKPRPVAKGAFRLDSAVREAIRVAHEVADRRSVTIADTIDEHPPPGLAAEERSRFTRAVQAYSEFVGDDLVSLHPSSGEFLERPSRTGRFRLTGRCDTTVVDRATGVIEIRRVHLGSRRVRSYSFDANVIDESLVDHARIASVDHARTASADHTRTASADHARTESVEIDGDALLTLLITRGASAETDVLARVRHLWLGASTGEHITDITASMVGAAAQQLNALVEAALADPVETPGWWCDACPAIRSCSAVSSTADQDLASRLSPSGEPPVRL